MGRDVLPYLIALIALCGCGDKTSTAPQGGPGGSKTVEAKSPSEALYEQLRSGSYQLGAAIDSIEEALKEAKATKVESNEQKGSLADIQEILDDTGVALTEEDDDPPGQDVIAKDMPMFEAHRKKLCNTISDALHDLGDARGIVDSLAPEGGAGPLENVGVKIDVAIDDLRGALEALGGKEETEGP